MAGPVATFSIIGADPAQAEVGVAVASKFLSVGSVVPWARADVGAVATQSHANTSYGPRGLDMLTQGLSPEEVIARLTLEDGDRAKRQLGIVSHDGSSATFTGDECLSWAGGRHGKNYAVQGNLLAGAQIVEAMEQSFRGGAGPIARRLLQALKAGDGAGGDRRGRQSAALLVVKPGGGYGGFNDRYIDLRVDDHDDPVKELIRLRLTHELYFDRPRSDDGVQLSRELIEELQGILQRTGDLVQPRTGTYDKPTRAALTALFGRENLEERWMDGDVINPVALEFLRGIHSSGEHEDG